MHPGHGCCHGLAVVCFTMFHGKYTVHVKISHALIAFIHMKWISAITNVLALATNKEI